MLKLKMGTNLEDREPGKKVLNYSFLIKYYASQKKIE